MAVAASKMWYMKGKLQWWNNIKRATILFALVAMAFRKTVKEDSPKAARIHCRFQSAPVIAAFLSHFDE